jgi:hypothetical protein
VNFLKNFKPDEILTLDNADRRCKKLKGLAFSKVCRSFETSLPSFHILFLSYTYNYI